MNRYALETYSGKALLALQGVLCFFLCNYTYQEIKKFYEVLKQCRFRVWKAVKLHFSDFWNAFECLILFIFFIVSGITALNEQTGVYPSIHEKFQPLASRANTSQSNFLPSLG